jgi:hypothetical protein
LSTLALPAPAPGPVRVARHGLVTPALASAGLLATSLIVFAGGRVGPIRGTTRLSDWFGLLARRGVNPVTDPLPGFALLAGVAALVGVWLLTVRALRRATLTTRRVWVLAACWSLPLLVGPPLLSGDVLTYVDQGFMIIRHLNPYRVGPASLGRVPASLVDPRWRSAPSPYGPLATATQWAAALIGGSALGAVVVLRVVATLSVVAIGVVAAQLVPPTRRPAAVVLTVLNPVVLLQVVSAAHLEGLMVALTLGSFLLLRRNHPYLGLVLATGAALVKAPALIAVGVIAVVVVVEAGSGKRVATGLRAALTVGVALYLLSLIVPDGWGWLHTALATPAQGHTPAAPTAWLDVGLSPLVVLTHLASSSTLIASCRLAGLLAAAGIGCWLILTLRRRSPWMTAGAAMLAVGLLGPVYYPWYSLWGGECLALGVEGRQQDWLVMLSAVSAMMSIPGLSTATVWAVGVVVASGALLWVLRDLASRGVPGSGVRSEARGAAHADFGV